jgi:hypothetical protein
MKFATITPTRSDRPELLEFCKYQLGRMEVKPDRSFFIDFKPKDGNIDIVWRVWEGLQKSMETGIDLVFIIEDDDYYDTTYFNHIPDADFIGESNSIYYNLRNKTYQNFNHPGRSSLFTTGFKISALKGFRPKENDRFLDISLWKYAFDAGKKVAFRETGAIGIKHGIGLCGGKGHKMNLKHKDSNLEWLSEHVDSEAFEFYKNLKL